MLTPLEPTPHGAERKSGTARRLVGVGPTPVLAAPLQLDCTS